MHPSGLGVNQCGHSLGAGMCSESHRNPCLEHGIQQGTALTAILAEWRWTRP